MIHSRITTYIFWTTFWRNLSLLLIKDIGSSGSKNTPSVWVVRIAVWVTCVVEERERKRSQREGKESSDGQCNGQTICSFQLEITDEKNINAFVVDIWEIITWELYMVENALLKSFLSPFHPSPPSLWISVTEIKRKWVWVMLVLAQIKTVH